MPLPPRITVEARRKYKGVSDRLTASNISRREVEAAGFRLAASGDFLRNPADPRNQRVFQPTQPNDEFVLKFVKPAGS